MINGAFGDRLGRSFRVASPPTLTSRLSCGKVCAATEIVVPQAEYGLSNPIAPEEAYLIGLEKRGVNRFELWLNGQLVNSTPLIDGACCFYDLSQNPVLYFDEPFHHIMLYIPKSSILEILEEHLRTRASDITFDPPRLAHDATVKNIADCFLPYLSDEALSQSNQLVIDHLFLTLRSHIALFYGGVRRFQVAKATGLTPWQQRKAKDMMMEHLTGGGISLNLVAQACRLSPSAFVRAFRRTFGIPPYQWLIMRRLDRSIELMEDDELSLVDIALMSGFADQSHYTRIFVRKMGVSPGAYRRSKCLTVA